MKPPTNENTADIISRLRTGSKWHEISCKNIEQPLIFRAKFNRHRFRKTRLNITYHRHFQRKRNQMRWYSILYAHFPASLRVNSIYRRRTLTLSRFLRTEWEKFITLVINVWFNTHTLSFYYGTYKWIKSKVPWPSL